MKRNKQIVLSLILCVAASLPFEAQIRPVNDYGALGLGHLLNRLNTTASVMMIGAHPDDEDSALLAYLARGENARTAYLSLTRGDGGQNIIGPELFEPLGIIRTEELLQARKLDGAEQYFTRAYDYGFSKTLAEAKSKWPEEVIKCDVVHALRFFRPLVVISRFTGTSADGHGQHQYAGFITPIAVKAAADPKQCTADGEPWQVLKFYIEQSFSDKTEPTLKINTGQYDPLLGRSYFEIAMEGRSMHRSQGEGRIEFHGDSFSGLNLVGAAKDVRENAIFEGIDISIAGIEKTYKHHISRSNMSGDLLAYGLLIEKSRAAFSPYGQADTVDSLLRADKILASFDYDPGSILLPSGKEIPRTDFDIDPVLSLKRWELENAIKRAIGFQMDALSDAETIVPGDDLTVSVKAFWPRNDSVKVKEITLKTPYKWTFNKIEPPKENNAAYNKREVAAASSVFSVNVNRSAELTQPYWLRSERNGDLFKWEDASANTLPFEPLELFAIVKLDVNGIPVTLEQPVKYRFADPARGEIRREINVVPALSVSVDRDLLIAPQNNKSQTKRLVVSVTNNTAKEQSGNVGLNIATSPDWNVATPSGSTFSLKTKGAKASIPFDITVPANTKAGDISIRASVGMGEALANLTMKVVSYPHIQTHRYYTHADTTVEVLDLKTVAVKVGYVMGSGDEVPEAIGQMGMDVAMLEEKDLSGDLSRFDTIVVGIRASETRPDMMASKQALLDYVKNGGTLIMQYQRGNFAQSGLPPYPVDTSDKQGTAAGNVARVVDENAAVKMLQPDNPVFNFPNKITETDFNGWVQERNAYNLVTFDPQYTPLLESQDAGEQENNGGLVVAKVGKGNWIYCSYSFFRQLPAGVPGAYRLFANLLALPKAPNH